MYSCTETLKWRTPITWNILLRPILIGRGCFLNKMMDCQTFPKYESTSFVIWRTILLYFLHHFFVFLLLLRIGQHLARYRIQYVNGFPGQETWSGGYGWRLMEGRSWVRIPVPYTGWTSLICRKNCIVSLKRPKIDEKEAGLAHFKEWFSFFVELASEPETLQMWATGWTLNLNNVSKYF